MSTKELTQGDRTALEIPMRSGNDLYVASFVAAIAAVDGAISSMNSITDFRPVLLTRQLIVRITDDEIRYRLFAKLDEMIAKIDQAKPPDERAQERFKILQIIEGECVAFLDEHVGVSRKMTIAEM
ncbi:MAG: hypothetical protein WC683_11700 [bacterium]